MYVGTIHSYCLSLLQDHVAEFGNYDVIDPNRLSGLMSREYYRLNLEELGTRRWKTIGEFLRNVDVLEGELIEPAALEGTPLGESYRAYCEMLERYHFLTFGQIINLSVRALQDPQIYEQVHTHLRHLIVDEYQDINPAQDTLIKLLARPPVHLCVVGDDDQSIYQWRGSDVSNILNFVDEYDGAETLSLSTNRRSRPKILKTANEFAQTISNRHPKEMRDFREAGDAEVVTWSAETEDSEAATIAATIAEMKLKGFRYQDIAILYRSVRSSATPLIEALQERDIPFRCGGRTGLFLQPEVSLVAQTYAWFCDSDWRAERYGESHEVTLEDLVAGYEKLFAPTLDIRKYLEDWRRFVSDKSQAADLVGDYYKLLRRLGVHELDPADPNDSARLGGLARFSSVLADYEHISRRGRYVEEDGVSKYRGGNDRGKTYYKYLLSFLQHYARDAYEEFEGEESVELDAVDILTVHQAKGLEWPVVFVPCLTKGRFPSKRSGQPQEWLLPGEVFSGECKSRYEGSETEERRLFYVAMTRARDSLYLSHFHKRVNKFQPSQFIIDVGGEEIPVAENLPLPQPPPPPPEGEDAGLAISFSELALYEGCPLRYRLSHLLGFQTRLAVELGYGRAIHHVLRTVADEVKQTGEMPNEEQVEALLKDSFYLPYANHPAFKKLYAAARRLISQYMEAFGDDLERVWATERSFEVHLEGGILSGRADVILDQEGDQDDSLAIVDYKTANTDRSDDIFAFQLQIYGAAARGEGLTIDGAYLHDLADGQREEIPMDQEATEAACQRAEGLIHQLRQGEFEARPELSKCRACDVRSVCKHTECEPWEIL